MLTLENDRDTAEMGPDLPRDLDHRRHPRIHWRFRGLRRHRPHPVLHLRRDLPGAADTRAHDIQGVAGGSLPAVIARSVSDEAIQTVSAEAVWIASLRSQ